VIASASFEHGSETDFQEKKTHNSKIILKLLLEKKKILYSNYVMDSGKIANSNTRKGNDIE
jgi:hypothetical protein